MTYIPHLSEVLEILRPNTTYSIDETADRQVVWYSENNELPYPAESELLAKSAEIPNILALKYLRTRRNQLLAETDFYANSDVTMSDAMRTYRQALRDLPANTTDPSNPSWPTKPSA